MRREIPPTSMRLPEELKLWLQHKAVDNRRTLTSEVIARLEESRKQEEEFEKAA
ncbi:Arc family DNA-binding protein [Chromobacterium vaccinii]|uniref:Arc family DNA-binding protein n=1 Tax=Chromobacterium vaccinii TaxID=1108595 RepID=UPI003C707535